MNNHMITSIVDCMASNADMKEIQQIQTEHRLNLFSFGESKREIVC
jgi:hypothetical protein